MSVASEMVNGATALGYSSGVLGYGIPGVGWGSSGMGGYGGYGGGWGGFGGGFPMWQNMQTQTNQLSETMHFDNLQFQEQISNDQSFLNANSVAFQNAAITQRLIGAEAQVINNRQSDQTARIERDIFEARLDAAKCCADTKLQMAQGFAAQNALMSAQNTAQQLQIAHVDQDVNISHVDINAHIAASTATGLLAEQITRDQVLAGVNTGVRNISDLILASSLLQPVRPFPRPLV